MKTVSWKITSEKRTWSSSSVNFLPTSAVPCITAFGDQHLRWIETYINLTWPEDVKSSVKVVLVHIAHDRHFLVSDLLVGPKDDQKKPEKYTPSAVIRGELTESTCLV